MPSPIPAFPEGLISDRHLEGLKGWISEMQAVGAPVDCRTEHDDTPLHYAAWSKHPNAARLLLKAGADPNAGNYKGQSPFHHAVNLGDVELIQLLHAHGGDWFLKDKEGFTPLGLFASPRSQGLRRKKTWLPGLAETLIALVPPEIFEARLCKSNGQPVMTAFAHEHGPEVTRMVELQASIRRLEQVIPAGLARPRARM